MGSFLTWQQPQMPDSLTECAFGMLSDSTRAVARELNVRFSAINRLRRHFRELGRKSFCTNCQELSQGCSTSPSGSRPDTSQRSGSVAPGGGGGVMVCYGQSGLNLSQNTLEHVQVPLISDPECFHWI